mgnify:CR=1 FL=1
MPRKIKGAILTKKQNGKRTFAKIKEDAKKLPEDGNVEKFTSDVKADVKQLIKTIGKNNNSKK